VSGIIYFIGCQATDTVKIGFTSGSPIARLRRLQTGNAHDLALLTLIPGTREMEKMLHHRLSEWRMSGEWFRIEGDVLKLIDNLQQLELAALAESVDGDD